MPDNTNNNFINSIRRTTITSQGLTTDRGSLLAQSLTFSRAGSSTTRAARTLSNSSGQPGRSAGPATGASNVSTGGPVASVNDATVLRLFDLNGDKQISDAEIIDVSLTKNFRDQDMASAFNAKAGDITRLVKKVDADLNGQISDVELAKALLAERAGTLSNLDSSIKDYLLNKNLNRAAIETELNVFDGPSADHIINDLEVLDKLTALKAAGTTITATTRAVLGTNPHYLKIQELVSNTNFSDINTPKEIFDFLLAARKFGVEDVFAARELSGNDGILQLVKSIDKDADGIISQREFIAGYVAINKRANPDNLNAGLFDSLIASQASFSSIPAFINSIVDINGNVDEADAATLIATNKSSLSLDVVKELSSNTQFKNLIGLLQPTPAMSPAELISVILAANNPNFASIEDVVFNNLVDIDVEPGTAYNNAITAIDQNANGIIDNDEVRAALLNNNNPLATHIDDTVLTNILSTNPKYAAIKQLVEIFDPVSTRNGNASSEEILKGLLEIRRLKLNINAADLSIALGNNDLLQGLPNLVNLFDPDGSGTISEAEYAAVMVSIAKGTKAQIDQSLLSLIETQVPNAAIIKNAIQAFVNDFDKALTPQELMAKFKGLIGDDPSGSSSATLSKVIGIIYPNADNLINVYLNFDTNHDDLFDDAEVVKGLLRYNSGQLGTISNTALNSIISQAPNPDAIKYALSLIDTKADGEISNAELVDTLMQLKRGDFPATDTKFNEDIFNQILKTNSNYTLAEKVMSSFNYAPGFKPTTLDLAASVLVQNHLNSSGISTTEKDEFLKMINMFGKPEIAQINTEISKLSTAGAFDINTKRINTDVLLDKSILLSLGKLTSSTALTALLRTNSAYAEMSRLFGKYSENKKLTENSLVKILVDANISDDKLKLDDDIKDYFISLLSGDVSGLFADYKASLPAVPVTVPVTPPLSDTEITNRLKNELLSFTITGSDDPIIQTYTNAINRLDPDHNGKMTSSDFFLHQFYFSNEFGTDGINYNFNKLAVTDTTNKVDDADKAIFDRVTNYLKINS